MASLASDSLPSIEPCTARPAHLVEARPQGLDVDGLDLVLARPDDLPTGVHGGYRRLAPDLDQHCAFIVAQAHTVAPQTRLRM